MDNVRFVNLFVRVLIVLFIRVLVLDDSDVFSWFNKKVLYSLLFINLEWWFEWLIKEFFFLDDEGCGWYCGCGLWGNVNSCWGVWLYVFIIVLRVFWWIGFVIVFIFIL